MFDNGKQLNSIGKLSSEINVLKWFSNISTAQKCLLQAPYSFFKFS